MLLKDHVKLNFTDIDKKTQLVGHQSFSIYIKDRLCFFGPLR